MFKPPVMLGPNISGTWSTTAAYEAGAVASGACSFDFVRNAGFATVAGTDVPSQMSFSAERQNATYSSDNKVQPPALRLLPCVKI